MKILQKTVLLILVIIKTTPHIIKTYKDIWEHIIKNKEEIMEKTDKMMNAYIKIKTNYVDETKSHNKKVEEIFKRQKAQIERLQNYRKGVKQNELKYRNIL